MTSYHRLQVLPLSLSLFSISGLFLFSTLLPLVPLLPAGTVTRTPAFQTRTNWFNVDNLWGEPSEVTAGTDSPAVIVSAVVLLKLGLKKRILSCSPAQTQKQTCWWRSSPQVEHLDFPAGSTCYTKCSVRRQIPNLEISTLVLFFLTFSLFRHLWWFPSPSHFFYFGLSLWPEFILRAAGWCSLRGSV